MKEPLAFQARSSARRRQMARPTAKVVTVGHIPDLKDEEILHIYQEGSVPDADFEPFLKDDKGNTAYVVDGKIWVRTISERYLEPLDNIPPELESLAFAEKQEWMKMTKLMKKQEYRCSNCQHYGHYFIARKLGKFQGHHVWENHFECTRCRYQWED